MAGVDFERLAQLKCTACGSPHKEVLDIMSKENKIIAKVVTCCDCGLSNFYAHSAKLAAGLLLSNPNLVREGMISEESDYPDHKKDMLEVVVNPYPTQI